jgi:hypothetical protein
MTAQPFSSDFGLQFPQKCNDLAGVAQVKTGFGPASVPNSHGNSTRQSGERRFVGGVIARKDGEVRPAALPQQSAHRRTLAADSAVDQLPSFPFMDEAKLRLEVLQNFPHNQTRRSHLVGQDATIMNGNRKLFVLEPNPGHFSEPVCEQPFCPLNEFSLLAQRRIAASFPTIQSQQTNAWGSNP